MSYATKIPHDTDPPIRVPFFSPYVSVSYKQLEGYKVYVDLLPCGGKKVPAILARLGELTVSNWIMIPGAGALAHNSRNLTPSAAGGPSLARMSAFSP